VAVNRLRGLGRTETLNYWEGTQGMDGSHKLETEITEINPADIDPKIYDLYDEYCHSSMERREFLSVRPETL
jgi:hypothetical protein